MQVWQTFNGLFIIRCLIKYIIETGSEYQLLQHFEALPNDNKLASTEINDGATTSATATAATNDVEFSPNISIIPIDGCKFESFFDAVVNMIVVIPVKYVFLKGPLIKRILFQCFLIFQRIYLPFTLGIG